MEKRFDSIVLVPLSLVIGFAAGIMVTTNNVPIDLINKAVTILLSTFVALVVIELLVHVVSDSVLGVLFAPEEPESEAEGAPGELTVLLLRDGDVVGEMKSWDKPLERGKRGYWIKRLGRIFARQHKIIQRKPTNEIDSEFGDRSQ
jgi:hypothetical protein